MGIKIIAAGATISQIIDGHEMEYSYHCRRPLAEKGVLAMDYAKIAIQSAFDQTEVKPSEIQLIVNISPTADRLCLNENHVGPRTAHAIQNHLQATQAYVFDLMDSNWVTALDTVEAFMEVNRYEYALLVRADASYSVSGDRESGFELPNGAGALIVRRDPTAKPGHSHFKNLSSEYEGCSMFFNKDIRPESGSYFHFSFPYQIPLSFQIEEYFASLVISHAGTKDVDIFLLEKWWPAIYPAGAEKKVEGYSCFAGPYEIACAAAKPEAKGKSALIVTFDPFNLVLGARTIEIV